MPSFLFSSPDKPEPNRKKLFVFGFYESSGSNAGFSDRLKTGSLRAA
jgi:hypothetical protein